MNTYMEVAVAAARRAGGILMQKWGHVAVEYKGEIDLVTEADKAAENAIIESIHEKFPDHEILAEESGVTRSGGRFRWIVDPLDGTTNYAHGLPLFCVSIALEIDDELEVGVIFDPVHDHLYAAGKGQGATRNGEPIRVSDTEHLRESLLVTGFAYDVRETEHNNLDHFRNFMMTAQGVRRLGAAAMDLVYVATGALEGFWELRLQPWDMAAGALLVKEAGGAVTDLSGRGFDPLGNQVLASNGRVHQEMVDVLRRGHSGVTGETL